MNAQNYKKNVSKRFRFLVNFENARANFCCSCFKLYKEKMLTVSESQIKPQLKFKIEVGGEAPQKPSSRKNFQLLFLREVEGLLSDQVLPIQILPKKNEN